MKSIAKKGRPQSYHRTISGEIIQGLSRLADGRWKISGANPIKFTEPLEHRAIARFHEIIAKQRGNAKTLVPMGSFADAAEAGRKMMAASKSGNTFIARISPNGGPIKFQRSFDTTDAWAYFTEQLTARPKWVAQRTGIEQLAWLTDLKKPTDSPKLADLIEVYAAKPGLSSEEVSRVRRFWEEFVKIVGVKTLREISHEHAEAYEVKVAAMGLAPKSMRHRYSGVRTVIAYNLRRGKSVADCRKALDTLAMLTVDNVHTLDPKPIRPVDFWAIHAAAVKADDKVFAALLLFSLNAALYSSEAGAVRWADVDLDRKEFVTRRNKTKVPRVAVLWPETANALKGVPRERETIFNTSVMAYGRQSIFREWTTYRKIAKVPEGVTFSMIRDAAFTSACRLSLDQARVLAGHRLPGAVDHYVLRQPQFVADACKAIHSEFYKKRK